MLNLAGGLAVGKWMQPFDAHLFHKLLIKSSLCLQTDGSLPSQPQRFFGGGGGGGYKLIKLGA